MAVTPTSFRTNFPEFASVAVYPESGVAFALEVADLMLSRTLWGRARDLGLQLFAAHWLVLGQQAAAAAAAGTSPGANSGPMSSKSVGPASASYDTAVACDPAATHWNLTTYGTRFWQMVQIFGAVPMQIGIGYNATPFSGGAWSGPWPWPIPGGSGFTS